MCHYSLSDGIIVVYFRMYDWLSAATTTITTTAATADCRVPAHMKGPLDSHWKIRDKEGYILNNDGARSYTVHQWDRWEGELIDFVDSKLYDNWLTFKIWLTAGVQPF